MSVGKYLSLEEARNKKILGRFAKEHPSTGDKQVFDTMFDAMVSPKKSSGKKSPSKTLKTRKAHKQ